jgi:DNA mismatch repair protein MSH4
VSYLLASSSRLIRLASPVRPEFTGTLAIKSGRHPVLEIVQSAGTLVPNDVFCDDSSMFQIVQGPKYAKSLPLPICLNQFPLSMSGLSWACTCGVCLNLSGLVGKSTYLKQIGHLAVMAMCGCFVPAEYASFRSARLLLFSP